MYCEFLNAFKAMWLLMNSGKPNLLVSSPTVSSTSVCPDDLCGNLLGSNIPATSKKDFIPHENKEIFFIPAKTEK